MRLVCLAFVVAGCSPSALPLTPAHPARADAPVGRRAEPPAALRPGVTIEPPKPPEDHSHHHRHGGHE
jgi:hypothetical protein